MTSPQPRLSLLFAAALLTACPDSEPVGDDDAGDDDTVDDDSGDDDTQGDDDTGDDDTGGCPDAEYIDDGDRTGGGEFVVTVTGFEQEDFPDVSEGSWANGTDLVFEEDWEDGPNDSPGFLTHVPGASAEYWWRSGVGAAEEDFEAMYVRVALQDYTGPGTYDGAVGECPSARFTWRGFEEYDAGYQATVEFDASPPYCTMTVGADPLSGTLTCTDVEPTIDGTAVPERSVTLEATWQAYGNPY